MDNSTQFQGIYRVICLSRSITPLIKRILHIWTSESNKKYLWEACVMFLATEMCLFHHSMHISNTTAMFNQSNFFSDACLVVTQEIELLKDLCQELSYVIGINTSRRPMSSIKAAFCCYRPASRSFIRSLHSLITAPRSCFGWATCFLLSESE